MPNTDDLTAAADRLERLATLLRDRPGEVLTCLAHLAGSDPSYPDPAYLSPSERQHSITTLAASLGISATDLALLQRAVLGSADAQP
jgi:hypothetical protein